MHVEANKPVVLNASSRPDGNTFVLSQMTLPLNVTTHIDITSLNIGYYSYENKNANDDFIRLIEQLLHTSVWVIATPLYWYTMSAQAKTFLDRLSDLVSFRKELGHQLRGKSLAVICSGTDAELPQSFEEPFRLTCKYLGMQFLGSLYCQFENRKIITLDMEETSSRFRTALLQYK